MTVDKMTVDKMTVDKMTVDKMTVDNWAKFWKLECHQNHLNEKTLNLINKLSELIEHHEFSIIMKHNWSLLFILVCFH
jgi:hypothetical protein